MKSVRGEDQWVWVVVQDPGGKEQFLGQQDQQENISFIPAFHTKEEAQQFFKQKYPDIKLGTLNHMHTMEEE